MDERPGTADAVERGDLLRMAGFLLVLLLVTGIVLLVSSGDERSAAPPRATMDGRLVDVRPDRLVLQPQDGGAPVTFAVRPVDARNLDMFHLEQHMRDELPSRVFYEQEGDTRYAVRVDDL